MLLEADGFSALFTNSKQFVKWIFFPEKYNKEINKLNQTHKNRYNLSFYFFFSFLFSSLLFSFFCFILTPLFERAFTLLLQFQHENMLTFPGNHKNSEKRKEHLRKAKLITTACSETWQEQALRAACEWLFWSQLFSSCRERPLSRKMPRNQIWTRA